MIVLFLALVVGAASVVAFVLIRSRRKEKAPDATRWIGPIGFVSDSLPVSARFNIALNELLSIVSAMESFLGKKIAPVVVVFVEGRIVLPRGERVAGIYHTDGIWTHPWIEVSVGEGDWRPKSIQETAFEHELLHHATKIADIPRFYDLLAKYKEEHQ